MNTFSRLADWINKHIYNHGRDGHAWGKWSLFTDYPTTKRKQSRECVVCGWVEYADLGRFSEYGG